MTIQQTPRHGTQQDKLIDEFLIGGGVPLAVSDSAKRYSRAIADPGEPVLRTSTKPSKRPPKVADETRFTPEANSPNRTNVMDR